MYLFAILLVANLLINWSGTLSPLLNGGKTSIWYYILFFAGFVTLFISYGYGISLLRAKLNDASLRELPPINIVKNFADGFKVVLSGSLLVILAVLFMYAMYFLNNVIVKNIGNSFSVIVNTLLFLAFFIVSFFFISMCCRYVVRPTFFNFLNFKAAAKLINFNVQKYFKSFLMTALCTATVYLISILSVSVLVMFGYLGLILYCVIVSLLWAYQIYIYAGLFSNAVESDKI